MDLPSYSASLVIARSPEELYDMVADVTRMGEWSPVCKSCWWDEGQGPAVGSWFTGRNVLPERSWETRSKVVVADRGQEFAFVVGDAYTRWGYRFTATDGGTEVTESWELYPAILENFTERFGDNAEAEIAKRGVRTRNTVAATLAALKTVAEHD